MPADANGLRNGLIQEIFWTRTGLLLLILLLLSGTGLALSDVVQQASLKTLLVAIGTGTLVSAIVGFSQTMITAASSQRALVTPLVEESRRALTELSAEYRKLNSEFFPTHVFEPTKHPDPAFNHLMMQDLLNSREYFFRGFSGRYAAARLLLSHSEWELRVVIADPRGHGAISGRARYLMRREDTEQDYEAIEARLHKEIYVGLVGLYLARSRCSRIDMTIVADPPLDRLEMFDDSAWITLFSDTGGAAALYPRALRFPTGSFIYGMERTDFLRVCSSRTAYHHLITPDTSRQEFFSLYEKITGIELTDDDFGALSDEFRTFEQAFSTSAELRS